MSKIAWSHSRLETYKNCPWRFYKQYVIKDTFDKFEHPAALWGKQVHTAIEEYVRDGVAMPSNMIQYERYAVLAGKMPNVEVERKFAVNNLWEPAEWQSDVTWGRAIADVFGYRERTAGIIDWKTGKYRGESNQAAINALMVFANYPDIDVVKTSFYYFKEGINDKDTFKREDIAEIARPTLLTISAINQSEELNAWPMKPSGLCGYCPVTSCQYNTVATRRG